ncbi:hypothetical protein [Kitasatospora griseola]
MLTLTHGTEELHTALIDPNVSALGALNAGTWWLDLAPSPIGGDDHARAIHDSVLAVIGPIANVGTEVAHLSIGALPQRVNDVRVLAGADERGRELAATSLSHGRPTVP